MRCRRRLKRLRLKAYNRVFLSILKNLRQVEEVDREAARAQLLSSDADVARWLTNKGFL